MKWLILLFPGLAFAGQVDIELLQMNRLNDSEMYKVGAWNGLQINYQDKGKYAFLSYEKAQIIPFWGIGDMQLIGAGFGLETALTPEISLFGQLGYYFISQENEGRHDGFNEGLTYYFNKKYGYLNNNNLIFFDEYQVEYQNTFGGLLGIKYETELTKNMKAGFSLSYRSMKIKELLRVMSDQWDYDNTGQCWEESTNRDYSSINYGINFNYQF